MIRKIIRALLKFYDRITAQKLNVSIGDLMTSTTVPTIFQYTAVSRAMDVEHYLATGKCDFPYQMMLAHHMYGNDYNDGPSQRIFLNIIKSFQEKGYDCNTAPLTTDKDFTLIDGTHRIGLCYVLGIQNIVIQSLQRHIRHSKLPSIYEDAQIHSDILYEIYERWQKMQCEMTEKGDTLCCYLKSNSEEICNHFVQDLSIFVKVRKTDLFKRGDEYTQYVAYALDNPAYMKKGNGIVSGRSIFIESIIRKRYPESTISMCFAHNCTEGRRVTDLYYQEKDSVK